MGRTIFHRLLRVVELEEPEGEATGKTVAAPHPVEDFQFRILTAVVELPVVPADRAPVVLRGRDHAAERRRRHLEVGKRLDGRLDHLPEGVCLDRADGVIDTLHLEAERCREILLVADHHIDMLRNLAVHLLGLREPTDALPEAGAVVEVVGNDRAVLLGRLHRLDRQGGGGRRQRCEDAARVKPPHPERAEKMLPVDIARLHLAGRRVAPVRHAHRATDAEAAFGEIEAVTNRAADAVIRLPLDEVGADASLHDEVFDEMPHLVVNKGGHHGGLQAEALPQAAGHVVFAAPLPDLKVPRSADAALARVEPEHDLAERDLIERT